MHGCINRYHFIISLQPVNKMHSSKRLSIEKQKLSFPLTSIDLSFRLYPLRCNDDHWSDDVVDIDRRMLRSAMLSPPLVEDVPSDNSFAKNILALNKIFPSFDIVALKICSRFDRRRRPLINDTEPIGFRLSWSKNNDGTPSISNDRPNYSAGSMMMLVIQKRLGLYYKQRWRRWKKGVVTKAMRCDNILRASVPQTAYFLKDASHSPLTI